MPRKTSAADPIAAADTVATIARQYDNEEGDLARAARARLAYRLSRSGKECCTCHETKPLRAFHVDGRERDGLARQCRDCKRARNAAAYQARKCDAIKP